MRHAQPPGRSTGSLPALAAGAALKALLLAGCGGAGLLSASSALAQPRVAPTPKAPLPDDGLGERDAYIEADVLTDDRQTHIVTARGNVEARTQGRTLRADEVIYDRNTGAAHARGHVVMVNADGTVQYGEDVQLDEDMRAGVAYGFSAHESQNVTLAAGAAIRRNENVQQLNNAIFTPCNICTATGASKTPTWSIKATRIVQDKRRHVIYYRNAVIRIKNIPLLYFPVFWHADADAQRRSGFLAPRIQYSQRRGLSYEQPYYWAISPYSDLTISPQFNTRVNPLLNLHYRQRTYSGAIDVRGGVTYEQNFTNRIFFDKTSARSYILAKGKFDITPQWSWGFGAERVTDPLFFRRYNIEDVFEDRGPYPTDTDRLISQVWTQRQDDDSFITAGVLNFQSIRAYGQNTLTGGYYAEGSKLFPTVGPTIEARWDPRTPVFGGRLRTQFSAVSLTRDNAVTSLVDPNGLLPAGPLQSPQLIPFLAPTADTLTYTDQRRATLQGDWRRAFTFGNGIRVDTFLQGRGDIYDVGNLVNAGPSGTSAKPRDVATGRLFGTAGADISWPFARRVGDASVILEPLAQIAVSPTVDPSYRIPNEDSVSFQYDETTLFSTDRFSGYDLIEGGRRLNVGGRATAYWGDGRRAQVLVGRTFRDEDNLEFTPQSGLRGTSSDWIVAATATPIRGLSVFNRMRLDGDNFDIRREEVGINVGYSRISGSARYLYNQSGLVVQPNGQITIGESETADFSGTVFFRPNWGVRVAATRDLQNDVWPIAQVALIYQDECLGVNVVYTHDETYGAILGDADTVTVRLTLATLGDTTPRSTNRGSR